MSNALIKYNSGNLAILCSKCYTIIKTGSEFNEQERLYSLGKSELESQYCKSCKDGKNKKTQKNKNKTSF